MNLYNNKLPSHAITVILLIIFSLLAINQFAPEYLNADTILFPVMSLQHVTMFIWGQDRLANFIPYLLSIISSSELNLFTHLFLFALSFFLLLLLCAEIIRMMSSDNKNGIVAFVILTTVSFIILSPAASYSFILEGQPYALSYLLLLSSFLISIRPAFNVKLTRTLVIAALFVATGLNPSILVPAAGLSAGLFLIKKDWRSGLIFVLIAVAMFTLWLQLSKWYGTPTGTNAYSAFNLHNIQENINVAITSILSQIRSIYVGGLIITVLLIRIMVNFEILRSSKNILGLIWIFAICWLLVFSNNDWIKLNQSHFRYFFPVFLALIFTLSFVIYQFAGQLNSIHRNWFVMACLFVIVSLLARPLVPFEEYAIFKKIKPSIEIAEIEKVRFVAGNYWDAWPMVFQMQKTHGGAFGLLYRGDGNAQNARQAFDSESKIHPAVKVLCMNSAIEICINDIKNFTPWYLQMTKVDCGNGCILLDIKEANVIN